MLNVKRLARSIYENAELRRQSALADSLEFRRTGRLPVETEEEAAARRRVMWRDAFAEANRRLRADIAGRKRAKVREIRPSW